ncbi:MAG: hypothetical protein ACXWC9_07760 [Pseudobdellovibrionaceae bacterium]
MFRFLFSSFFILMCGFGTSFAQSSTSLDSTRAEWIVRAFNQVPEQLNELLTLESVKINGGVGRVMVNKKAKFAYYIQTENPVDPNSRILLIPMATSRFTPTYYQTDQWWDAHKDMKPMPRQPMDEVQAWLEEMKLTSNPDVLIVKPDTNQIERIPLQKYLLEIYVTKYARNGKITVYRGAEKDNEPDLWEKNQRPPGVRYWTPTANYAWRYARKNLKFIELLVDGKAPLLKFEIPVADFRSMTDRRWPRLTLGTELTKNAHNSFDSMGKFMDHLTSPQADYLGEGQYGVEFEIRSNKAGANDMSRYYQGMIGIQELAEDRAKVIQQTLARLKIQRPAEAAQLEQGTNVRLKTIQSEAEILLAIQKDEPSQKIADLIAGFSGGELTKIDGFNFKAWASQKINQQMAIKAAVREATRAVVLTCHKAHR